MLITMETGAGGGGVANWKAADSYPTKGIVVSWDGNPTHVIVRAIFNSNKPSFMYIDLSNPTYIKAGNFSTGLCDNTLASSLGLTIQYDASNKKMTITHSDYGWSNGYVLPLNIGTDLS